MTVGDLIKELGKFDPDTRIIQASTCGCCEHLVDFTLSQFAEKLFCIDPRNGAIQTGSPRIQHPKDLETPWKQFNGLLLYSYNVGS